ncbi:MAG: NADH-quinone oxidoreductase subunit C [Anaerolineaceae bacterium]|jgi:NADH-quinone oxidoreductase subunit C
MNDLLQPIVSTIRDQFSAVVEEFRGEVTLILQKEQICDALLALRDEFGFKAMIDETSVDYWPEQAPRFHVVYHVYSHEKNLLLQLRVPLDGNGPHIPTVEGVYPNANWKEREIYDLMGITFDGHSDMRRILMPFDWVGHPLRKDSPLGYEEVQFTFNFDEIDLRKPYAKD